MRSVYSLATSAVVKFRRWGCLHMCGCGGVEGVCGGRVDVGEV